THRPDGDAAGGPGPVRPGPPFPGQAPAAGQRPGGPLTGPAELARQPAGGGPVEQEQRPLAPTRTGRRQLHGADIGQGGPDPAAGSMSRSDSSACREPVSLRTGCANGSTRSYPHQMTSRRQSTASLAGAAASSASTAVPIPPPVSTSDALPAAARRWTSRVTS